ncbi:hypothetical protein FQR65_LT06723 [Abscondita terminalis]|nr:hypothetical protein FQR65_LT06723 [Abscondita terminalis]
MYNLGSICWCIFSLFLCNVRNDVASALDSANDWNGKWFPNSPDDLLDSNPSIEYVPSGKRNHIAQMGVVSKDCDDAQTNLTIDWNNSPINYTCFESKYLYFPKNLQPIEISYSIPRQYSAAHKCMDTAINYRLRIPTFGTHRPLWAKFGEYMFLPIQRWLHNLEHGAIVLLYHPCANMQELVLLKKLVKKCLYRHVITPYTLLTTDYPFALVAWGYSLEMSMIDPALVIDFIKTRALRGPEMKYDDGQYDYKLMYHANIVSDERDSDLCPNM